MPTTRSSTRSSVLGKRSLRSSENSFCEQQLQTPESTPNPKRARVSSTVLDGDSNKENVPPISLEAVNIELVTPRTTRELSRTATELITPTRPRPAARRHASTPVISSHTPPTRDISLLAISTPPPTPPTSLLPIHARARTLLRSTCNNTNAQIAGRESERAIINEFLASFLDAKNHGSESTSLYITGSPGTGKTALLNSVIHELKTDAKIIFINCMALQNIESLWERLIEEFDGRKQKPAGRANRSKGREMVEQLVSSYRSKCIVILDELDHITPTAQALTSLFSLPNTSPAILRLIGIANTHTLTSSSTASSIMATSNVRTLHFAPYTPPQLLQILQSRLSALYDNESPDQSSPAKKFLPVPTLTLLTKKVAALTGDVRSLFEVLRGAVDMAITASALPVTSPPSNIEGNLSGSPTITVTPAHILAALKAYTPSSSSSPTTKVGLGLTSVTSSSSNSEIVTKISNLGLQARLVLLCILLASKRLEVNLSLTSGSTPISTPKKSSPSPIKRSASLPTTPTASANGVGIEPTQLHTYYGSVLERHDSGGFEAVSRSEFGDLVGVLEGIGLISLGASPDALGKSGARRVMGRSASLNGGAGFGGKTKGGKGSGEVRLAGGVRVEEVLRGLGITTAAVAGELDVKSEEVRAIWQQENARQGRDLKAIERKKEKDAIVAAGFEGALED